jgi:undecaprenyl-diphosphatase
MTIFQAVIFGIVQGVTEFLPVSSTAHLILLPWFLGWPDPGLSFDVALHLGTLVALVIYFWKDWLALLAKPGMVVFIIAATIPGALAGVLFENQVENALRSPKIIALMLSLMALVLVVAELKGRRKKDLDQISWRDALTVGFAQAFALVPGVSRSGSTITAGLFVGMKRETAARFSFYLSAPIIAGAVAKKMLDIFKAGIPSDQVSAFVIGIAVSGIVGYLSIAFLLGYLKTHNTFLFVYYRIALAIVVFLAFWFGFR